MPKQDKGAEAEGVKPIVTVSCLGNLGRFGNCLFQYAFARGFAEQHGAILQTPKWIGQELFDLNDPPISVNLPTYGDHQMPNHANVNLSGYFQAQKHVDYFSRHKVREWFTFKDKWQKMFPKPSTPYIAAHVRRGDYKHLTSTYCLVSEQSYINACVTAGRDPESIVWVREETQIQNNNLPNNLSFLGDFFTLKNADVLLRGNSTFSWWAGALGNGRVLSPIVGDKLGIQNVNFTEGNHPCMVHSSNTGGIGEDLFLK